MSVKIRMSRVGRNKVANYRIVVADGRAKRDGRFIEVLGTYDPQAQPKKFSFDAVRMAYWLKKGATPSETVDNLLKQDRFAEKMEGAEKGLSAEQMNIARKPERTRKPKKKKEKKAD